MTPRQQFIRTIHDCMEQVFTIPINDHTRAFERLICTMVLSLYGLSIGGIFEN